MSFTLPHSRTPERPGRCSVSESLSALAGEGDTSTVQKDSMSESLIVQVGDSLCERNDKILDTTEDAEDTESQSQSDDK